PGACAAKWSARTELRIAGVAADSLRGEVRRRVEVTGALSLFRTIPGEVVQFAIGAIHTDAEVSHELSLEAADELICLRSFEVAVPTILVQRQCRVSRVDAD